MFKTETSKKYIITLLTLLIVLNIVLRIVSIPHETGNDSYQIHALANSISQFGEARWWVNWLSVFGLYSYSYASGVPFFLSGLSQLLDMDMEKAILLYCMMIGVFSIASAYLMAGCVYNNFRFKYLFAFFFSISQGILQFTLFDASTRGLFMVIFPLFIYVLLNNSPLLKKTIFLVVFFILLRSIHNFSYFTLPLVVIMMSINIRSKIDQFLSVSLPKLFKSPSFSTQMYIILISLSFLITFFMKPLVIGSRYQYIMTIIITTTRYAGPLIFLMIGGHIYMTLKAKKTSAEWFVLISSLLLIPISFSTTYGKFMILPFVLFFVAVGFNNLLYAVDKKKVRAVFAVIMIISLVVFSSYYNHYRTGPSKNYWYMAEETNQAGIWTRTYIPENTHIFTTVGEVWRMLAISNGHIQFPSLPPLALTYGFLNTSDVSGSTFKNSYKSMDFYFDGPYVQKSGTSKLGEYYWIMDFDVENERTKYFFDKYDIKYIIYDRYSKGGRIINSVQQKNALIYDNNRINIWST